MSDENKTYPTHRVSFATKRIGKDGEEQLGRPVDIGAIWPRKGADKAGGILRLDVIPKDLHEGVMFVTENERQRSKEQDAKQGGDRFEKVDERAASSSDRGQGR